MRTPRSRTIAATLATAALLAACGSDPEPKFDDPTPSASSTPSQPTTSPVVESPSAAAMTPEDVVRAWVAARNSALLSGDTSAVDALSASNCRSCKELNKVIEQVYEAGGRFTTDGWAIKSLKRNSSSAQKTVDAAVVFGAGVTIASEGASPVSYGLERHILTFELTTVNQRLMVQKVLFR